MKVGAIEGDIILHADPALRAFKETEDGAWRMKKGVEGANLLATSDTESKWKKNLGMLKGEFGKSSELGQTMKLLAGGGAVAGISMAGNQLNNFSKEMVDVANALRDGKGSTGEMVEKIAGSLPLLGSFWQAGRNIRETITGEAHAEAQLVAILKAANTEHEKALGYMHRRAEGVRELRDMQLASAAKIELAQNPWKEPQLTFEAKLRDLAKAHPEVAALADSSGGLNLGILKLDQKIADTKKALEFSRDMRKSLANALANPADVRGPAGNVAGLGVASDDDMRKALAQSDARLTHLDSELGKLKTLKTEAQEYNKTLGAVLKERDLGMSQEADKAAAKQAEALKGLLGSAAKWIGSGVKDLFGGGKDHAAAREIMEPVMRQLPPMGVKGEQVFGPHRVTAADLPPGYEAVANNAKQMADNTKPVPGLLQQAVKLLEKLAGGTGGNGAKIDVVASEGW